MGKDKQLYEEFFDMEMQYSLFEYGKKEHIPYWDICRMEVYLKYYWPDTYTHVKQTHDTLIKRITRLITRLLKSIIYFITNNSRNLIIPHSRYKDSNGLSFDQSMENIIQALQPDCFIIEDHSDYNTYRHKASINLFYYISLLTTKRRNLPDSFIQQVFNAINNSFGTVKISKRELNDLYMQYQSDYNSYLMLLRFKKFSKIYFVQNGLQKGLIKAASKYNIETIEMQHGSFEVDHLGYSYPGQISHSDNIAMAGKLYTLGDYWGCSMNIPVNKIVAAGNDYFYIKPSVSSKEESILVISSMIHYAELVPLAQQLSQKYEDTRIIYKLHSNEYSRVEEYCSWFAEYKNIEIHTNQTHLSELMAQSLLIVIIASTVVYEALSIGKKVAIYKRVNYKSQSGLFDEENVFLVDNINDIGNTLNSKSIANNLNKFFIRFSESAFKL